jgi:hypothetical protein
MASDEELGTIVAVDLVADMRRGDTREQLIAAQIRAIRGQEIRSEDEGCRELAEYTRRRDRLQESLQIDRSAAEYGRKSSCSKQVEGGREGEKEAEGELIYGAGSASITPATIEARRT